MIINEIRIGIARTINLGNFESLRVEGSVTATIPEGDDLAAAKRSLQTELRMLLEETYLAQHKMKKETRA